MSKEDNQNRGADSQSGSNAPEKLSGVVIAATLFWEVGKKLGGFMLRKAAQQPPVKAEVDAGGQPILSERASDRTMDKKGWLGPRWGTFLNVCLCLAALGGAVGFLVIYWTGGSNEALGGFLAIFFAALAWGLVINVHVLAEHKEATEPRKDMASPPDERAATAEAFRCGQFELQRRGLLKWMAAIGIGSFAAFSVSLFRSVMPDPYTYLFSRSWMKGQRLLDIDGQPVKAEALAFGSTTIVFPEDRVGDERSQTVLIRVNSQLLELPPDRADWAPQGNLAFSRICTHAGCPVGLYEKTAHLLMCPCHQSTFDVLRGAQPTGGPAARSLPQLPLYVDADGFLRARGDFSKPPGPGFWGIPS